MLNWRSERDSYPRSLDVICGDAWQRGFDDALEWLNFVGAEVKVDAICGPRPENPYLKDWDA